MNSTKTAKSFRAAFTLIFICLVSANYCWSQSELKHSKGYGKAQYKATDRGTFMKNWLIAGPFPVNDSTQPDASLQEKAFKSDIISAVNITGGVPAAVSLREKQFKWQPVSVTMDIVDLDTLFQKKDFAYAYALAEIIAEAPTSIILGLGSDDGIKVWLNGKLVHDNWIPRGIQKDNDVVPLKLVKGSNQLLLKVQDMSGGWGFMARALDKLALTEQLNAAAANGNLDKINLLVGGGADLNASDKSGVSPIVAAKIGGREEIVQLLKQKGATDKDVPAPEALVDNLYSSLKGKEISGMAVLAAKDGRILYRKSFGYADVKNKIPVTPDTKFRIGSVTKQFTAVAILKLQEKNLLSVNDKLSKFIPDFPRGDEVTIHHLLTHTSGIRSYTGKGDFVSRVTQTITPDSLVAEIKRESYDFNPGEKMLYNNSGYFLLGYIISKVSGKSYDAYLKETFFDPLKMENTGVHYSGIKLSNEAKGHEKVTGKYTQALDWDMSWAGGAGAMYSTVDDLAKWNQALYEGKVIDKKSLDAALTPATLKGGDEPPMKYGYGLIIGKFRGTDVISHSGGLHGFVTQLAYYPAEKITVVMFSNNAQPEANFDPNKIAEAFLWDKLEKQISYVETAAKPVDLKIFTGRYDLLGQLVITVTTTDNKLFAQLSGQPKFEIFPRGENEFFWKVVEARIKFIKDENGEVNQAILFQNGQEMKAKRLPEEKIVKIDPRVLDGYIGRYKLNDNITVVLTKENDKLFAEPTGQPKVEMSPLSETEFVINDINARISFTKDASGKATGFKLKMNGREVDVPRIESSN